MRFSSVGMTWTPTRLPGVEMRGARAAFAVGVELHAHPGAGMADSVPDRRRVLANAGGEDDAVQPTHRPGERGEVARDLVDEDLDREAGARLVALQQVAEVRRDAGQPQHA